MGSLHRGHTPGRSDPWWHPPSVRQVLGGGTAAGDAPCGGDVVGGDSIPQVQQDVCILNGLRGGRLFGLKVKEVGGNELQRMLLHNLLSERKNNRTYKLIKKRGTSDVRGLCIPRKQD